MEDIALPPAASSSARIASAADPIDVDAIPDDAAGPADMDPDDVYNPTEAAANEKRMRITTLVTGLSGKAWDAALLPLDGKLGDNERKVLRELCDASAELDRTLQPVRRLINRPPRSSIVDDVWQSLAD